MTGEILGWILSGFQIEAAIIAWRIAGKSWLITFLTAGVMGTLGIIVPYGGFTIILLTLEKAFGISIFSRFGKWNWVRNQKRKRSKNVKANLEFLMKNFVRKTMRKVENHPYFILFFLNLLPMVPYLTLATVFAVKLLKIRRGILAVLAGNWLKIALFISIAFRL